MNITKVNSYILTKLVLQTTKLKLISEANDICAKIQPNKIDNFYNINPHPDSPCRYATYRKIFI